MLQSYESLGTFYAFRANKIVNVRGNNREIPFVGVVSVNRTGLYPCLLIVCNQFPGRGRWEGGGGGGGGDGTQVQGGRICVMYFAEGFKKKKNLLMSGIL